VGLLGESGTQSTGQDDGFHQEGSWGGKRRADRRSLPQGLEGGGNLAKALRCSNPRQARGTGGCHRRRQANGTGGFPGPRQRRKSLASMCRLSTPGLWQPEAGSCRWPRRRRRSRRSWVNRTWARTICRPSRRPTTGSVQGSATTEAQVPHRLREQEEGAGSLPGQDSRLGQERVA
jgi:hypothetical protein